ncbi:hypothetical protein TR51_19405 [Kitasatospora griseola]|uniref:Uncharacterized protein n=2 Tax=Kitasatospora griseola TaxID=2064 RepID=A0A0D0NQV6_KITGR|nr:hypothetical protein TR51_19405 [Kitasatospora griseola]
MIIIMADEKTDLLACLWDEFSAMRFPTGWYDREPEGTCLVTLDTALVGFAANVLDGPPLGARHREHLRCRIELLAELLPAFGTDSYASRYFVALYRMAVLAEEIDAERGAA